MNSEIIFVNGKRISKFLGIKVNDDTKLESIQDQEKTKEFIRNYGKYLYSNKIEDIKEFYNLTGLMLTHIYEVSETTNHIFSMNYIHRTELNSNAFDKPVYTTHILVITKGSDNNDNSYYSQIFWKNQSDKQLGNKIRYNLSCICKNIRSKINCIEEKYDKDAFKQFNKKEIKQVELTVLNNMCVLLKNGDLWIDNKLYSTNVDTIWHQDSYNSYIIYKDNKVEKLVSEFAYTNIKKYKKVVYNNTMLATLHNKVLNLIIIVDLPDVCVLTSILGIDDIEINKDMLYGIIGDFKFKIPTWYNTIVVDNR